VPRFAALAFLLLAALPLLVPSTAVACGGFFFDIERLVSVEQNAERMLFEVNDDDTITATLEIRYAGEAEDFSWVLPVPSEPIPAVVPAETLALLDAATAPRIIPPPTKCTQGPALAPQARGGGGDNGLWGDDDDEGVDVVDLEQVGPYESRYVSSADPDALIDWLNAEGFLVTPEMEPVVSGYVDMGMGFMAMKLAADAQVSDIQPISLTFDGDEPMVPIVIASVAAEPEMGIIVLIAGEDDYGPVEWGEVTIAADDVQADPRTMGSNYYPLASWRLDEAGGEAVIPELFAPTSDVVGDARSDFEWNEEYDEALTFLDGVADRHGRMTRYYTRLSGWEMLTDPGFLPADGSGFDGVYDLSDRAAVEVCANPNRPDVPCGELYCGLDAMCATTGEGDGCVCPSGFSARLVEAPKALRRTVEPTVVCEMVAHDMTASLQDLGLEWNADPCADTVCGAGECLAINGFPTCQCDEGTAAVSVDGELSCETVKKTYGPDALLWAGGCGGCGQTGSGAGASLAALLLLPLVLRRRRP
jgi:hypothetical protein